MSCPELEIRGTVLNQEETGENFVRLHLFGEAGLRLCLLRKIRKLSAVSPPDLFDEVEITLQAPKNHGLPFIKEHQVIEKRMSLAFDRECFDAAGSLARFYIQNGEHLLEPLYFFQILQNALRCLIDKGHPSTVLLKSLYLFAREEGLPVKESWFAGLSPQTALLAQNVLKLTVKESKLYSEQVPQILESLRQWLSAETELVC